MTLNLRNHVSPESSLYPNVSPDVSAAFDDPALTSRSDSTRLSDARRVALVQDRVRFENLVAKGAKLHGLTITDPSETTESSFTAVQDLEKWGYMRTGLVAPAQRQGIGETMKSIGVSAEFAEKNGPNVVVGHTHEHPMIVEGALYPATDGLLCQIINPLDGVIVAYDNITAGSMTKELGLDPSRVPKLDHWSDIAYLQWLSKAYEGSNLRYVLRYGVINHDTRFVVNFLGLQSGLIVSEWPGRTYRAGSPEFSALLGSPNGSGVAYLLIQHKRQLGHKTVDRVTIFRKKWDTMLLFYVTDVEGATITDTTT
jgi:hypothetical protein